MKAMKPAYTHMFQGILGALLLVTLVVVARAQQAASAQPAEVAGTGKNDTSNVPIDDPDTPPKVIPPQPPPKTIPQPQPPSTTPAPKPKRKLSLIQLKDGSLYALDETKPPVDLKGENYLRFEQAMAIKKALEMKPGIAQTDLDPPDTLPPAPPVKNPYQINWEEIIRATNQQGMHTYQTGAYRSWDPKPEPAMPASSGRPEPAAGTAPPKKDAPKSRSP